MSSASVASMNAQPEDGAMATTSTRQDQLVSLLETINIPKEYKHAWQEGKILSCLQSFLQSTNNDNNLVPKSNDNNLLHSLLSKAVMAALQEFYVIDDKTEKLAGRKALQQAAQDLLDTDNTYSSSLMATILVVTALALDLDVSTSPPNQSSNKHRSISSAIVATITKHRKEQGKTETEGNDNILAHSLFHALFQQVVTSTASSDAHHAVGSSSVDWHIISGLAKALNVDCLHDTDLSTAVAKVVSEVLKLDEQSQQTSDDASIDSSDQPLVSKTDAAAALALAAQLQPWQTIEPKRLVHTAIQYDLWHAAERICTAATTSSSTDTNGIENSPATKAVEAVLEAAFEAKRYRQADTYATEFFHVGGRSRFLEARYFHACGTIAKVIRKGAIPIVDKQIDRVEKAAETMKKEGGTFDSEMETMDPSTAGNEIRNFAFRQLEETGNVEGAYRLADLWNMDYVFDKEALLAAEKVRRETYLQWEDVLPGSPPDLLSTPEALLGAMKPFYDKSTKSLYGFDVEWNENDAGADLLQIANQKQVLLVDIPALSKTPEGFAALEQTVGAMFASPSCTMVGFSCQQDISKLRSSPTCYRKDKNRKHWFDPSTGVILDLQAIVAKRDTKLGRMGLSRTTEQFLSKPLDKSEQCSCWSARPLSLRQRTYAALDAWTIVGILDKIGFLGSFVNGS